MHMCVYVCLRASLLKILTSRRCAWIDSEELATLLADHQCLPLLQLPASIMNASVLCGLKTGVGVHMCCM
jgi:hypothetical protein